MTRRLDAELVVRGLARSRGQARELIEGALVLVDGRPQTRAATPVEAGAGITLTRGPDRWVGRAALKLLRALELWGPAGSALTDGGLRLHPIDPTGRRCLDVGASTGGFTQVLLEAGAASVVALDVGHGQLSGPVAADPRVTDLSGTNIRDVRPGRLGDSFDIVVADVSFISLALTLPPMRDLAARDADLVVLVKPQFEVGRDRLGRGGVVRSPAEHRRVLLDVHQVATDLRLTVLDGAPSPIRGTGGNREFLLWMTRRPGAHGRGPDDMLGRMDLEADS